ncbi:MAG: helicase associated domain-containing protein [Oscillospiraceae bacterium]|nr:helicase associated domain-containing protein [Oscillospiraceae bacterium]
MVKVNKRINSWNAMYDLSRAYYIAHGDLNIPSTYVTPEGVKLGAWLNRQRQIRAGKVQGSLTPEQIRALDAIGMSWLDLGEERWNRNFRALRAYFEQYGNIDVPQDYVTSDGLKLGRFVKNMRFHRDTKYRRCLTPERLNMLDEMGMIWDVDAYRWEQNFRAAEAYYREHGDLRPAKRYTTPDGVKLGTWLAYQREKHSRGELEAEKVTRLNAIDMAW